jgi:hypothetical protein
VSTIFQKWVPVTDGFGYSGDGSGLTYTGKWWAPYTADTLTKARALIDFKDRFNASASATDVTPDPAYPYKRQIEHSLIPMLTAQRMKIAPSSDFAPNVMDTVSGTSADGLWIDDAHASNIIENADTCMVHVEWMIRPVNTWGVNCAYMSVNGTAEFLEMDAVQVGYCMQDTRTGTGFPKDTPGQEGISVVTGATPYPTPADIYVELQPLAKGHPLVEPRDVITIEYPWVDASLVNHQQMRRLRGAVNYYDISIYQAGTLLYEGSDVDPVVSPLGYPGYRVVHHFVAKNRDYNLVPVMPKQVPAGSVTWRHLAWGWATMRPPMVRSEGGTGYQPGGQDYPSLPLDNKYSSDQNRIYRYGIFWDGTPNSLFFYGFAPGAPEADPPVNPFPF